MVLLGPDYDLYGHRCADVLCPACRKQMDVVCLEHRPCRIVEGHEWDMRRAPCGETIHKDCQKDGLCCR